MRPLDDYIKSQLNKHLEKIENILVSCYINNLTLENLFCLIL